MGISEILKLEANSSRQIILLREGIFWRAYERSAYLFTSHVKPYQLTKRYFKNVGCEVAFCGFPNTALDELLAKICDKEILKEDDTIRITGLSKLKTKHLMVGRMEFPIL